MPVSFIMLYTLLLSLAFASLVPELCATFAGLPVSTFGGGPLTPGILGLAFRGLCASVNILNAASSAASSPVHGFAPAISLVPFPALDGSWVCAMAAAFSL